MVVGQAMLVFRLAWVQKKGQAPLREAHDQPAVGAVPATVTDPFLDLVFF